MNAALMLQIPHLFRNFRSGSDGLGGGRNQMDHTIVIFAQIAQKSRQHGRGVRLGVVQQDDTPAGNS